MTQFGQDLIIINPIQTIGFNREIAHMLRREEFLTLVTKMYKTRMQALSGEELEKRLDHPKNAKTYHTDSDIRRFEDQVRQERIELQDAYDQIVKGHRLDEILEHYRPMEPEEIEAQALKTQEIVQDAIEAEQERIKQMFLEYWSDSRETIMRCGPCSIEVDDAVTALNLNSRFRSTALSKFSGLANKKVLNVDSQGFVNTDAESTYKKDKRLFLVTHVPNQQDLAEFLTENGFRCFESNQIVPLAEKLTQTVDHEEVDNQKLYPEFFTNNAQLPTIPREFLKDGIPVTNVDYYENKSLRTNEFSRADDDRRARTTPGFWYINLQRQGGYSLAPKKGVRNLLVSSYKDTRFGGVLAMELEGFITNISYQDTGRPSAVAKKAAKHQTKTTTKRKKKASKKTTAKKKSSTKTNKKASTRKKKTSTKTRKK